MKSNKTLSLVLALAFVLVACAPAATPTAAPKPTDTPKPIDEPTVTFPTGKFIKDGTTDYGLMFNADGTFWVFEGDNIYVRATYTVDGNILTETSNDGGCDTNVSFTYTFEGTNLTFNYVGNPEEDASCTGRHADFNGVTYTLVQ